MAARVYLIKDGYAIKGAEPPGLRKQPAPIRILFWGWLMEAALKQKDRDLSMGLDRDGEPLRPITAATRRHRKSKMTPTGKGDPSAPPLQPGRKLSRVRSLLTGRAEVDRCEFWWKFDPFTHESFAKILEKEKDQGRDVFGLSPAALKRSVAQAWDKYAKWEAGKAVEMPIVIGVPQAPAVIAPSGGKRVEDWEKLFRQPKVTTLPAQGEGEFNVLLSHIFKVERPGAPPPLLKAVPPKPAPPKPTPIRRAAMGPKPRPKPIDLAGKPESEIKGVHRTMDTAWRDSLSPDTKIAFQIYAGNDFKPINAYLRSGRAEPDESMDRNIARIDRALALARMERARVVYRGIKDVRSLGLDPANLAGATIEDAAFLSTSLDPEVARAFIEGEGGAILRIIAPAGSHGASLGDVALLKGEFEVLFARGQVVRIIGSRRDAGGTLIIEAELKHG